jgi:hypothetical protein
MDVIIAANVARRLMPEHVADKTYVLTLMGSRAAVLFTGHDSNCWTDCPL